MSIINLLYNPQEIPEKAFLQSFVVRRALLERLLKGIHDTPRGRRFQHVLLQGQRGQGKSTLLRMVYLSVRDDPALSGWLIPILFKEEEYSVRSLCHLWERTADYLAECPSFENLNNEFGITSASVYYEEDCFKTLNNALERKDKHLLLLIDSFGEMLDKFDATNQQRFREILITCHRLRIVGASIATLKQDYDQSKPFFQFFRMHTLNSLDAEETRELMLSRRTADQQKRMAEILKARPGKLEVLRRITGGVPRTLIQLFEIFLDDDGDAMKNLNVLLDQVTPLYKHRIDALSTQQQAIVYELAMGWDALSTKEIAEKTRLESKAVSSQLKELEKNGIVNAIQTSNRNKLYQLEERFLNIWCLMRLGRSADKNRAMWLVRFLEMWCDREELAQRARKHIETLQNGEFDKDQALILSQVYARTVDDLALQSQLLDETIKSLGRGVAESLPESDYQLFSDAKTAMDNQDFGRVVEYLKPLEKKYQRSRDILAGLSAANEQVREAEIVFLTRIEQEEPYSWFDSSLKSFQSGYSDRKLLAVAEQIWSDVRSRLMLSSLYLCRDDFAQAFRQIEIAMDQLARERSTLGESTPANKSREATFVRIIEMLAASKQTAFALKLFEDPRYATLRLKDRFKPLYYAILREAGPVPANDALRMGSELVETVTEIRQDIQRMRRDYRVAAGLDEIAR
ncbi:MAG: hypothetical protein ACRESZ_11100 [Methylococcales bacterium]